MPVRREAFAAVVAVATVGCGMMSASILGQNAIFSEAQAYERFMGRWSRDLAPQLVRFAAVRDGDTLLDIGSGTGALSAALAAAAPSGSVVGIDPAASYVALAQASQGGARVRFQLGDAQHMDFEDATFDRTLSLLVVNFLPDANRAVEEMKRVTRRGGTVAAAVWDYGEGMEMLRVFWDEAIAVTPASDSRDERHMPFCGREIWRRSGANTACWTSSKRG